LSPLIEPVSDYASPWLHNDFSAVEDAVQDASFPPGASSTHAGPGAPAAGFLGVVANKCRTRDA